MKPGSADQQSSEAKDLVVFDILRESKCADCGKELLGGDFLFMEGERPLCLTCADLDHLVYLPRGDTALTRRARKHSALSAVVVRFSRARKRYERQGVLVEESALEQANADLRKAIMALQPGEVTPVERTAEGYRILKVITREPAGQRLLDDPSVQQTIRETLLNRKDQLLKAAYYEVARDEAKVVNYLASSITGTSDQK